MTRESEDKRPSRYYVKYESGEKIAAAVKAHGEHWRDEILTHDDIMSVRNFASLSEAEAFRETIARTGHYAELVERRCIEWVCDLREWAWEGEVLP